jgi:predicted Zn-dependent peptidase
MFNESRDYQVTDYSKMVKAVTPADIQRLAAKYINLNNYVAVTLRPEDGAVGTAD